MTIKLKAIILTALVALILPIHALGQDKDTQLIQSFYKDLYNDSISPETVVSKYIKYADQALYQIAVNSVKDFRNPVDGKEGYFGELREAIIQNKYLLQHYKSFDKSERLKFQHLEEQLRQGIYKVILNGSTRSTYILIRKSKVISFFGFQKAGDDTYMFFVYQ